jgi:hypothetical protein
MHLLLTPPLTPSSSIQSTTAEDSIRVHILSHSLHSPFVLVKNIPKFADTDNIKLTFSSLLDSLTEDIIKGIFIRYQQSHRFIVLAFYDSRHAAKIVQLVTGDVAERLFVSIAGGADIDSSDNTPNALICRSIFVAELSEVRSVCILKKYSYLQLAYRKVYVSGRN